MSDLIFDQFSRLLQSLSPTDPWPALEASGFLDLLLPEAEGGADLSLDDLFPLALETGRLADIPGVVETMVARRLDRAGEAGAVMAPLLAAAVAAARMAGAMEQIQDMTVEYANTRRQFGREIGKFQAIQHQVAVMAQETAAARMAAQLAFTGAPLAINPHRAGLAKLRAGEAAWRVSAIAHAVFGAIGVSHEHHLQRFTGALYRWRMAHGGESYWARRLGAWALSSDQDAVTLARGL